jgi:hypothetical protein
MSVEGTERVRELLTRLLASCSEAIRSLKLANEPTFDNFVCDNPFTDATRDALQEVVTDPRARELASDFPAEVLGRPRFFRKAAAALSWVIAVEQWARLFLANLDVPKEALPSGNNVDETETARKEPTADAIAAYRAFMVKGGTQRELAELLTVQLQRPIRQGTVSRWISEVGAWVKAGNVLPDLPTPQRRKPVPMDPERIDLGRNREGRAQRQRQRRDSDD